MLYNSEWLDQELVGWIQISLLPQSLAWLLGFGANHSLLFFVQYWQQQIETRQLQYKEHIVFLTLRLLQTCVKGSN